MIALDVEVLPDAPAVALRGAGIVAERARTATAAGGRFSIALSGGRTPWAMLAALAAEDVPWEAIDVFQVDDRVAPEGNTERNLTHIRAALPTAATLHPMDVTRDDLDEAAAAYAQVLPAHLDLVHLGLGADGHTASLVPGDSVLEITTARVAATEPYQGRRRLTLTYPALAAARTVLWLVTGSEKAEAVAGLVAHDRALPAGRVTTPEQLLVVDRAAASRL